MNGHIQELLPEMALGTLAPAETAAAEAHVAACEDCRAELRELSEALFALPLGAAPIAPSAAARTRLLDEVGAGGRLHRFADRVAELLEIEIDRARHWLDRLDDPAAWIPLPVPGATGISACVPEMSERLQGNAVAFLRIAPGGVFPMHTHLAAERVLLLQGGYVDEQSGVEYHPGDVHAEPSGHSHSYRGLPGPDCLCLGVVYGHVRIGDTIL